MECELCCLPELALISSRGVLRTPVRQCHCHNVTLPDGLKLSMNRNASVSFRAIAVAGEAVLVPGPTITMMLRGEEREN